MIKAILFDIGNVLIHWPGDAVNADIQTELGMDEEQFKLFAKKYLYRLGLGEITEEEVWAGATEDFNIRAVSASENLLGRTFESEGNVFRDVLEFARSLKKRGFKMAVLSNTISAHERVFTGKGVTEPFDYIFLSHAVKVRKPDPRIYIHALSQLQVEPSEALFIDDLKENIDAADKLGLRTVWADSPTTVIEKVEHELGKDFIGTKAALIHNNKVLAILRDDKKGIPFPGYWDFPGGAREENESPMEVAIREIREELNITLDPDEFVWQKSYPGAANKMQTAWFVVANLTGKEAGSITLGDEGQKWKFMTFREFLDHPKAVDGMKTRLNAYILTQK